MLNILLDKLPDTVDVDGSLYSIRTDFRVGIMLELLMKDKALTSYEKLIAALKLFYIDETYPVSEGSVGRLMWYLGCGEAERSDHSKKKSNKTTTKKDIYSYEYDAKYIYSAFLEQYGIDLTKKTLHWWQFRALFESLDENTKFCKIIGYRSTSTTKMGKEEKLFYSRMKKIYALPDERTEEEKQSDFARTFAKGIVEKGVKQNG